MLSNLITHFFFQQTANALVSNLCHICLRGKFTNLLIFYIPLRESDAGAGSLGEPFSEIPQNVSPSLESVVRGVTGEDYGGRLGCAKRKKILPRKDSIQIAVHQSL